MKAHPSRAARRGALLVESAIVLLSFLVMVLGMLDYGLAVLRRNALSEAARRLARAAIVRGEAAAPEVASWGPAPYESTAAEADEIAAAARPVLVAMKPDQVAIRIQWIDGGNRLDQRVRVAVEYEHRSAIPFIFGGGSLNLNAASVMRIVQ